ncbi:hypothetical protein [Amycolatopsis sp. DG1A-15b]|uniref:hypothetical protein n=1 Tax=Amycolatopsis sp. DG1A-15b TaxID=3052846 RepID=UPI00255B4EDE|nr:hypothetical protein [Amycolatopsis sp. DG1A-15b]WIX85681.1 hypothetical protein QRY02_31250 [Amycolatopsis sp. DG1A-15b]
MGTDRQVLLHASSRAVHIDSEVLRYSGVTVQRVENGEMVGQSWIPLGADPSYADDETLVATWHAALRWSQISDDAPSGAATTPLLDS